MAANSEGRMSGSQPRKKSGDSGHNCFGGTRKLSLAKLRWRMLSKALHEGPNFQSESTSGSMRRFTSFGLIRLKAKGGNNQSAQGSKLTSRSIGATEDTRGEWFECTCDEEPSLSLDIRLLTEKVPITEWCCSDNTGNICVWPSEEILSYYCVKNKELCTDRTVCELGGGQTCLCGLVIAATCDAKQVILTDGNARSVANVSDIVKRNWDSFGKTTVKSKQLRWGHGGDMKDIEGKMDVVLCSDCLYFDEGRQPLVETIWKLLSDTGLAVILAPSRGTTFQQFVDIAKNLFEVEQVMVYDLSVWELHQSLVTLHPHTYQPELHYPRMIVLRKPSSGLKVKA